jgi:hypothetical protein
MKIDWEHAHRIDIMEDYEEYLHSSGDVSYLHYLEQRLIAQYGLYRKLSIFLLIAAPLAFIVVLLWIILRYV